MQTGSGLLKKSMAVVLYVLFFFSLQGCQYRDVSRNGLPADGGAGTGRPASRYNYSVHYVQPGDTLYSMGLRYGVGWQLIKAQNHLDSDVLEVGSILLIPTPVDAAANGGASALPAHVQQRTGRRVGDSGHSRSGWSWPLSGNIVREYGAVLNGLPEPGIAIGAPADTPVRSVADGVVVSVVQRPSRMRSGWGNVVAVRHNYDMVSWYAHLNSVSVREGDRVRRGGVVGTVGKTGAVEQNQLAFRLFRNERPVDPGLYLP